MAPESASADVYTDVADASFLVTVPTDVLPNGLPFGNDLFRNIWVGPAFNLIICWITGDAKYTPTPHSFPYRMKNILFVESVVWFEVCSASMSDFCLVGHCV